MTANVMNQHDRKLLQNAQKGDIKAFHKLFSQFHGALKAYLYRLLADRNDADDFAQDTFVKAFDKIGAFRGSSSLKTWCFTIATNLARDELRKRQRWPENAQDIGKAASHKAPDMPEAYLNVQRNAPHGAYEIREHIDFCFTCIAKTLPIEQQIALILKDIYAFTAKDTAAILNVSLGVVKHLLHEARSVMTEIFDRRCALVSKTGVCHQCTELNGLFNPKQVAQAELIQIELTREAEGKSKRELFELRTQLVSAINPLTSNGSDLQDAIMQRLRKSIGEIDG